MAFQDKPATWQENRPLTTTTTSSSVHPDNQDYWYYCSHSYIVDDHDKDKYKYHKDKKHLKKMDTLICNSHEMLREYFDPKLYPNHHLPYDLFQTCKGIMFLRIWKAGLIIGGIGGTGIVMSHVNGTWSNPCAVTLGGIQFGLNLGVEKVDDILFLHDDAALRLFIEKGHFKMGLDASIAMGNFGRDANTGITMSGGESKSIYSYSFAKGAFVGLSLDGGVLSIDDSVNEEFYGRKITPKEIFHNEGATFQQTDDLMRLREILNQCSLNQQKIVNQPANIHNIDPIIQ